MTGHVTGAVGAAVDVKKVFQISPNTDLGLGMKTKLSIVESCLQVARKLPDHGATKLPASRQQVDVARKVASNSPARYWVNFLGKFP